MDLTSPHPKSISFQRLFDHKISKCWPSGPLSGPLGPHQPQGPSSFISMGGGIKSFGASLTKLVMVPLIFALRGSMAQSPKFPICLKHFRICAIEPLKRLYLQILTCKYCDKKRHKATVFFPHLITFLLGLFGSLRTTRANRSTERIAPRDDGDRSFGPPLGREDPERGEEAMRGVTREGGRKGWSWGWMVR